MLFRAITNAALLKSKKCQPLPPYHSILRKGCEVTNIWGYIGLPCCASLQLMTLKAVWRVDVVLWCVIGLNKLVQAQVCTHHILFCRKETWLDFDIRLKKKIIVFGWWSFLMKIYPTCHWRMIWCLPWTCGDRQSNETPVTLNKITNLTEFDDCLRHLGTFTNRRTEVV